MCHFGFYFDNFCCCCEIYLFLKYCVSPGLRLRIFDVVCVCFFGIYMYRIKVYLCIDFQINHTIYIELKHTYSWISCLFDWFRCFFLLRNSFSFDMETFSFQHLAWWCSKPTQKFICVFFSFFFCWLTLFLSWFSSFLYVIHFFCLNFILELKNILIYTENITIIPLLMCNNWVLCRYLRCVYQFCYPNLMSRPKNPIFDNLQYQLFSSIFLFFFLCSYFASSTVAVIVSIDTNRIYSMNEIFDIVLTQTSTTASTTHIYIARRAFTHIFAIFAGMRGSYTEFCSLAMMTNISDRVFPSIFCVYTIIMVQVSLYTRWLLAHALSRQNGRRLDCTERK